MGQRVSDDGRVDQSGGGGGGRAFPSLPHDCGCDLIGQYDSGGGDDVGCPH